jgi:hypothetical protein
LTALRCPPPRQLPRRAFSSRGTWARLG